ncbi:calcium-binding protein [Streptomyces sp. NPDC004726]
MAAVTGALVLTTLAAPAVQADEKPGGSGQSAAESAIAEAKKRLGAKKRVGASADAKAKIAAVTPPRISNVVVNGGKPLVVGLNNKKFSVTFKAATPDGVAEGFAFPWRGTNPELPDGVLVPDTIIAKNCTGVAPTCRADYVVDPWFDLENRLAGPWKTQVAALASDGETFTFIENARTFSILREARLTVNASPEPVKKNRTLTVTGGLRVANWDRDVYSGYRNLPVQLEFRKKGSTKYSVVKRVSTDSKGNLKTTVKATTDGYWRYKFVGNSKMAGVVTAGDYVDVR